jgi:synaptosomal-associated protein 29
MASRQRPAGNPFLADDKTVDDDVADSDFLKPRNTGYVLGNSRGSSSLASQQDEYARKRQLLLDERRAIEDRTLQSAKNSLSLVYEAEKVGITTAEELVRQGEKLSHVDAKLDEMNSTMRVTQKHLTSMKSMFGGLKNYFSGKSAETPAAAASTTNAATNGKLPTSQSESGISSKPNPYRSKLNETIDSISNESKQSRPHPAFARQGIAFEDDDQSQQRSTVRSSSPKSRSKEVDKVLDENLSELGLGLSRLKNLALGLGTEIESQDEMLNRIMQKEERAEETIGYQNRQMKQILKK